MRVNIHSRSLAALVFLAIVAVSQAVVWWVPVWKQTTVLRYHPKKGWYPIKHAGTGSTFLKPKKLPPLSQLVQKASQHYRKILSHKPPKPIKLSSPPILHQPIPIESPVNILHHPKYRGWRRNKPIRKPIHPPDCISCHHGPPSSWKPSKPNNEPKPKPPPPPPPPHRHRPPSRLNQKRRPRPRPSPRPRPPAPVPNFKLDFPSPFRGEGPLFPPADFLPVPQRNRNRRPRVHRGKAQKTINKYNPFHKIISSHFSPGDVFKKVKPFSKARPQKQFFNSVVKIKPNTKLLRPPPPPPRPPKIKAYFRLNKSPRVPPKSHDFIKETHEGSFNFNNFPKVNTLPRPPKINSFYSSFGDGIHDVFKIDSSPLKGPLDSDFLTHHDGGGFSFNTFPKMNNPPSAPQLTNFFITESFGNSKETSSNSKPNKPYHSPRVPRVKSHFPLFSFPKLKPRHSSKVHYPSKALKQYHHRPRPNHRPRHHPGSSSSSSSSSFSSQSHQQSSKLNSDEFSREHFDSHEEHPKRNHLQNNNAGVHHSSISIPKEFSSFGGFSGFGHAPVSGFASGQNGQGWGDWRW